MKKFPVPGFRFEDYIDGIEINLKINKSAKIASMGSCFAREVKNWLQQKNFNYMQFESDKDIYVDHLFPGDKGRHKSAHSSCSWERVYHTHTFNQITKYSLLGKKYDRLIKFTWEGSCYFADIMRTRMVYADKNQALSDIEDHTRISNHILQTCEIFILTLGYTEVEIYNDIVVGSLFKNIEIQKEFKATSFAENLSLLAEGIDILKHYNPNIQILLTVSPVHLLATRRFHTDCISASCASKSILRACVDELIRQRNVHYFPSYEIATIVAPLMGVQSYPDNHHVSGTVVDAIMKSLMKKCIT